MNENELILEAMRKTVDKAMAAMKKDVAIVSPIRCSWESTDK